MDYDVQLQLGLVLRTLQQARKQLSMVDGMDSYVEQLDDLGSSIEQELAELLSIDR